MFLAGGRKVHKYIVKSKQMLDLANNPNNKYQQIAVGLF